MGSLDSAKKVVQQCDLLMKMSLAELKKTYIGYSLPTELGMEKKELQNSLRRIYEWEAMPIMELQKECRERGFDTSQLSGSEDTLRQDMLQMLLLSISEQAFVGKGVPAKRLGSLTTASELAVEIERIGRLGWAELRLELEGYGLPLAKDISKEVLAGNRRKLALWNSMPVSELVIECKNNGREPMHSATRIQLLDLLLLSLCSEAFRQKGVPAQRLSSLKAAQSLSKRFESFVGMTEREMRSVLGLRGVPTTSYATRHGLLDTLKSVALWETLSYEEMRAEYESHYLPPPMQLPKQTRTDEDRKAQLHDLLLLSVSKDAFAEQGIRADELKSFAACSRLAKRLEEISSASDFDLKVKYKDLGLNPSGVERHVLDDRLRQAYLWMEAPLIEVQRVCRQHRVNSIAREGEQVELVMRLVRAIWQHPTAQPAPPPQQSPPKQSLPKQPPPRPKPAAKTGQQKAPGVPPKPMYSGPPKFGPTQYRPPMPPQQPHFQRQAPPPPRPPPAMNPLDQLAAQIARNLSTLGVSPTANFEDVKRAYRRLALRYHPDKNPGQDAAEEFRKVSDAHKSLLEAFQTMGTTGSLLEA